MLWSYLVISGVKRLMKGAFFLNVKDINFETYEKIVIKIYFMKTRADGFVRAEGCGALVLKSFREAVRMGDNILGLIRGTALNNDGPATSFGTPNAKAQERVFREALANANIAPNQVSVVEAHGTGTIVGGKI